MRLSQGTLKRWAECPLRVKYKLEGNVGSKSGAMVFGNAIHMAVMDMEIAGKLKVGLERFEQIWNNLAEHDLEYDYLLPGTSFSKYAELGPRILTDWWELIQWDTDIVIAREYEFCVPVGDHEVPGFIDKLAIRTLKGGEQVVLVSDYKTGSRVPTLDSLRHDLQFTAYCYATTVPEFWDNIENGTEYYESLKNARRVGEWVHLRDPRRVDAGERNEMHYNRLRYAVNAVGESIFMGIFPPTISGESCTYCDFRESCGLPKKDNS